MIILGNYNQFSQFDKEIIDKKFPNCVYLKMVHFDENDVKDNTTEMELFLINEIKKNLDYYKKDIVVINFSDVVTYKVIHYLVGLDLSGVRFYTFAQFHEKYLHKCYIHPTVNFDRIDFLTDFNRLTLWQAFVKHTISFFAVTILIILSMPVLLISAIIVKFQSSGPVFFKQKRVGLYGKTFDCYKFRSMVTNDATKNPYTSENDDRVTSYGKIMRRLRIDELPQLFNVAKRDISLIGPRTEWDLLVEDYEKLIPFYKLRHLVRPGITGWAQVNYPYGTNLEDTRQKLMYDLYYIKHWSPLLELKVYLKTIETVLCRRGV